MEKIKITVYTTSEFFGSVIKYEGYLLEHGSREYAQYKNVPFVKFIPRGKRKPIQILKGYKPYILILKDWNNINPDGMYGEATKKDDVIIRKSSYKCFDDRYKSDFDVIINQYKDKFLADYRNIDVYTKF